MLLKAHTFWRMKYLLLLKYFSPSIALICQRIQMSPGLTYVSPNLLWPVPFRLKENVQLCYKHNNFGLIVHHQFRLRYEIIQYKIIYTIFHEKCTRVCCVSFCCGYTNYDSNDLLSIFLRTAAVYDAYSIMVLLKFRTSANQKQALNFGHMTHNSVSLETRSFLALV